MARAGLNEHVQMLRELAEESKRVSQAKLDEYDMRWIQDEMDIAQKREYTEV